MVLHTRQRTPFKLHGSMPPLGVDTPGSTAATTCARTDRSIGGSIGARAGALVRGFPSTRPSAYASAPYWWPIGTPLGARVGVPVGGPSVRSSAHALTPPSVHASTHPSVHASTHPSTPRALGTRAAPALRRRDVVSASYMCMSYAPAHVCSAGLAPTPSGCLELHH